MNKIAFVGGLYVLGLSTMVIGGVFAYQRVAYAINGGSGIMTSTDPDLIRWAKYKPDGAMYADVVYTTAEGSIQVARKHIRNAHIVALARGQGLHVRFMKHDPHAVFYEGEDIPHGLWILLGGSLLLSLAGWSHRKLREEAVGQGLGGDIGIADGD